MLMTTTNVPLTGVMQLLELSTTMQSFAMTRTLALTNLATLQLDASSPMLEQNIATTTTFAPSTDALLIRKNASTPQ